VTLLRLEADDPEVLELTGIALHDALDIPDPPLRVACQRCGAQLGRGGDTAHGPLFTTSWLVNPPGSTVITVNGRVLSYKTASRWVDEHEKLLDSSGKPLRAPIRHGVRALLTPGLVDYPDLLVRCLKHGDQVLDRDEVLGWIRQAACKPINKKVVLTQRDLEYRPPKHAMGPSRPTVQSETRLLPFDVMTVDELERRLAERHRIDTPS
jgi:hypothetical protein